VYKRGVSPSFFISPSPFKERGIKGVRLIYNIYEEAGLKLG